MSRHALAAGMAIWFAAVILAGNAGAGSFNIVPTRLFLKPDEKTAVIRIRNGGEDALTLQLDARLWRQGADGTDLYDATKDILVFPKIVTLPPGEVQVVRLGYRGETVEGAERTYRLFVEELPVGEPGGDVLIRVLLRVGVPIFIQPADTLTDWAIADARLRRGAAELDIRNAGSRHARIGELVATGFDDAGNELFEANGSGWYVLPGSTRTMSVALPEEPCRNMRRLVVRAKTQQIVDGEVQDLIETLEVQAAGNEADCAPPPVREVSGAPSAGGN